MVATRSVPAGVTIESATSGAGSCSIDGQTASCAVGDLLDGTSTTMSITVSAAADGTYDITISPPLADFPGDDPVADTVRVMSHIEDAIREAPEQYFWVHRRFKGAPTGDGDPYDALADEDAA